MLLTCSVHSRMAALILVAGLLLAPLIGEAQPARHTPHVRFLVRGASGSSDNVEAFRRGLRELGYVEGQNVVIEYRYTENRDDRLEMLATDRVRTRVDVIVTWGSQAIDAAQRATRGIPIVIAYTSDPVKSGWVASLARPGGNVTGLSANAREREILRLAAARRLPAIYQFRRWAHARGLVAYGPSPTDMSRRAARYVDRILKGAKPADLPVEQPTKFELIINLGTASALGLTAPSSVLARADEVIR
jgi:ABC-type uncharacterized transport system substrate-binding protein